MNLITLQSIATLLAFIAFLGVAWWAFSPKNKKRFEEDAQLALDDDDKTSTTQMRNKDK